MCLLLGTLRPRDAVDINGYVLGVSGMSAATWTGYTLIDVYGDFRTLFGLEREFLCLIRPTGTSASSWCRQMRLTFGAISNHL